MKVSRPAAATIAILDDDIRFIRMVERVLREESIAVFPVTTLDLEEAVRVVAAEHCSLAIIDVFMYGNAAGFDLVSLFRANPATASLPLIVSSGASREVGQHANFLRAHDCGVLLKPFTPDALIAAVRERLAPAVPVREPFAIHTPAVMGQQTMVRRPAVPVGAFAPSGD